jgi:hypothetical protein
MFAVGGAGRGEFLVAFLELQAQVYGLLFEMGDLLILSSRSRCLYMKARSTAAARAMPETLSSAPSAVARSSAAMTRWWRRAESACRPFRMASVRGLAALVGAGLVVPVM